MLQECELKKKFHGISRFKKSQKQQTNERPSPRRKRTRKAAPPQKSHNKHKDVTEADCHHTKAGSNMKAPTNTQHTDTPQHNTRRHTHSHRHTKTDTLTDTHKRGHKHGHAHRHTHRLEAKRPEKSDECISLERRLVSHW